jgi:hypothetical protein
VCVFYVEVTCHKTWHRPSVKPRKTSVEVFDMTLNIIRRLDPTKIDGIDLLGLGDQWWIIVNTILFGMQDT